MRDSDTYLYILDEGRMDEVKKLILKLGPKWMGAPGESARAALDGITDLERLERMAGRLGDVQRWEDLLAVP